MLPYNSDLLTFLTAQFKVASVNLLLFYIIDLVTTGHFCVERFLFEKR